MSVEQIPTPRMPQPEQWLSEHKVGVVVALLLGAAVGLILGFFLLRSPGGGMTSDERTLLVLADKHDVSQTLAVLGQDELAGVDLRRDTLAFVRAVRQARGVLDAAALGNAIAAAEEIVVDCDPCFAMVENL